MVELLAAVGHLEDGHPRGLVVEEVGLSFEEDGFWEGGWTGGEVEDVATVGGGGGGDGRLGGGT